MKFEDLSVSDLDLLKGHAIQLLNNTQRTRFEALAESTLDYVYAKGYTLVPYPDNFSNVISKAIENSTHSADLLISEIFKFIKDKNIDIVKDDTRLATWSTPKASWYTPYNARKKPWVF